MVEGIKRRRPASEWHSIHNHWDCPCVRRPRARFSHHYPCLAQACTARCLLDLLLPTLRAREEGCRCFKVLGVLRRLRWAKKMESGGSLNAERSDGEMVLMMPASASWSPLSAWAGGNTSRPPQGQRRSLTARSLNPPPGSVFRVTCEVCPVVAPRVGGRREGAVA